MEADKTAAAPESKLHFLDYWRIIRIRKTVILTVFLLVVLTTVGVTFILPETYSSSVRIAVEKDATDIPGLFSVQSQNPYDPYWIQTQFEKIQSKAVLYKVIEELGLCDRWAKRMSLPKLEKSVAYQVLTRQIDVRQTRNTSLIEIRVYDESPKDASEIANKIADVYRSNRLEGKRGRSEEGIRVLQSKLEDQNRQVKDLQEQADKLRKELNIADAIAEGTAYTSTIQPQTVRQIEQERVSAQGEYIKYAKLLEEFQKKTPADQRKAILTALPDSSLQSLMDLLAATEQQLARLAPDLGPENPEIKRLVALQTKVNEQIVERVDGILTGLSARVASLKAHVDSLKTEVEKATTDDIDTSKKYRPYFIVKRELENQITYRNALSAKILQETVENALPKQSIVEITDPAEPGLRPVRPNIPLNIALGVVVGLIMGFGMAFFIEYLDTSVKTIDDVERALSAPVLGVIPQNVGSLLKEGPESPHAEAYRVLRTNVLFARKNPTANSLTVVSGGAGEGKSTTIFNLATVFAQNGQRVLIVDSDLRRPSLHKLLNVSNSLGLTNFLLKQNTLEQVIQTTAVPTLDFLPSGKLPSSSLGILNSVQMKDFIAEAKRRYDFVFFDSPPIMGVSDASILASEVDLALLVIQYRKYPQAMTLRAKQMVEKVGGNLLGMVLNNINISQDSYYYYYSGYYYDYYSKHDDKESDAKKPKAGAKASGAAAELDLKKKY